MVAATASLLFASTLKAADIRVMISGGFSAAYKPLGAEFERKTGNRLITILGPSMGDTTQAIPNRLLRGEQADVLIMAGDALDRLVEKGVVVPDSRIELARSRIGMVVKAGAPKPDISSVEKLKKVLLNAKSIAYSDSASGVYIRDVLFPTLGVDEKIKGKSRMIQAEPVAAVVARGESEIGFQQISEILPIPGATFVGAIPQEVQKVTSFAAGVVRSSSNPQDATSLIRFLSSSESTSSIAKTGLDPVASPSKR
jgi:molybdate transport system substrate-binding protein